MHKFALVLLAASASVAASVTTHLDSLQTRSDISFFEGAIVGPCASDCKPFITDARACPNTNTDVGIAFCVCTATAARNLQSCINCVNEDVGGNRDNNRVLKTFVDEYNSLCGPASGSPTLSFNGTVEPTTTANSPATKPSTGGIKQVLVLLIPVLFLGAL